MPSCAACGRPLDAGASFCTACGAIAPTASAPAAPAAGRTGRAQEPWAVPVLTLVTLGIYMYVWAWRVTREVDAWRGTHAHAAFRRATFLVLAGTLVFVGGFVALLVAAGSLDVPEDAPPEAVLEGLDPATAGGAATAVLAGVVVLLVGTVFLYMALWRVWRALEAAQRERGGTAISPPLMLLLMLVPYLNMVGTFYVLYRTQKDLNAAWATTEPPVMPAPRV